LEQLRNIPPELKTASSTILTVSNLSVKLQQETILDNISFKVGRGTTVAIVGPNGAGKTTLLKVLLGLVPHIGEIKFEGKVRIGYVPQQFLVPDVPITVSEFLSLKSKIDFEDSLHSVGLDAKNILHKRMNAISGGEMQRVLIAWAIVDKPDILLFDEPTTNVDIGSEEIIYETLNKLEKALGMTILLISHDMHVVTHYSDYVLALNKSVIFYGDPKKLSDPLLLKKIYGTEALAKHEH